MGLLRNLGVLASVSALIWGWGCSSKGPTGGSATTSGTTGGGGVSPSTGVSTGGSSSTTTSAGGSTGTGLTCASTYTTIPKGDCDLLKQDCPSGKHCDVAMDGSKSVCTDNTGGVKGKGAECTTGSECKDGLQCVKDSAVSHCSPFCCPDSNKPCDTGTCDVQLQFGNFYGQVCSYLPKCDLFSGTCKSPTECHLSDPMGCLAVCDNPAASHVDEGGKCKYRNDCGDSQFCNQNSPDMGVCRHFCDTTKWMTLTAGKGGCLAGRKCAPINSGCTNLGYCIPS